MSARGTLALVAIALALGAYVWIFEIRGGQQKAEAEAAARVIFTLDPATATALELDTPSGAPVVLARTDASGGAQAWNLTAPVAYAGDVDAVERALRALAKLSSTATIDAHPTDLEPFGLGASRKRVTVKAGDGEPRTLYLGGSTPIEGGRYVELASDPNRIFVVATGALDGLTPTLVELRDKHLLRSVTPTSADELTVRAGGELVVHAKKGESGWLLVEPENAPADAEKIRRVLDDISLGRASGFEDEPKPRAKYGLTKPAVEIVVRAGEAEERLSLASADGHAWLERAGDPVILAVNERLIPNVPRTFFDYRAKRVLTLEAEQVRALELEFPREGVKHRLKREGEVWKSDEAGLELQPQKVEDLVYALTAVDATGLEEMSIDRARIGLEPALAVVRAYDDKGAVLGEVAFGDPQPDEGMPALSSQSPLVWRVKNDIGRELPLSPEAFTNLLVKPAKPPAPPAAKPEAPASP